MICKDCGTVHADALPGSTPVEAALWLFMVWPIALVYTLWRRSAKHRVCRQCGSARVVGLDTPGGQEAARRFHPAGVPAAPPPPPPPRLLGTAATALAICAPFGLFMAYQMLTGPG